MTDVICRQAATSSSDDKVQNVAGNTDEEQVSHLLWVSYTGIRVLLTIWHQFCFFSRQQILHLFCISLAIFLDLVVAMPGRQMWNFGNCCWSETIFLHLYSLLQHRNTERFKQMTLRVISLVMSHANVSLWLLGILYCWLVNVTVTVGCSFCHWMTSGSRRSVSLWERMATTLYALFCNIS